MSEVIMYWRPGCPYCMRLRAGLRSKGITATEINIWEDPRAAAEVRAVADGNETVPTVLIAGKALVNPSARVVAAELDRVTPGWDQGRDRGGLWSRVTALFARD